jgi:hypothetical protein
VHCHFGTSFGVHVVAAQPGDIHTIRGVETGSVLEIPPPRLRCLIRGQRYSEWNCRVSSWAKDAWNGIVEFHQGAKNSRHGIVGFYNGAEDD